MENTPLRPGSRTRWWIAGLMTATLMACASTPPPRERVLLAGAAVDSAVSAGATELAQAELERARSKLEAAKVAMARGDNARAQVLAEQAEVDGLVARNKAGEERARRAAAEVQKGLQTLREQGARP